MKYLKLLIVLTFLVSATMTAQYKKQGDSLVKVERIKAMKFKKPSYKKTELTVTIKKVVYPVYKGKRGGYFIIRTSKRTNKEYFQYIEIIE